jgi:chromosome segregation ATPase
MKRVLKSLTVVLVAALGVWGCAQGPNNPPAGDRVRALEARCAKLEEDYRAAAAARDQARKQTAALEEERARLEQTEAELRKELEKIRALVQEREELRQQVALRTKERDKLQDRCERLKATLRAALEDEPVAPATTAVPPAVSTSAHGGSE